MAFPLIPALMGLGTVVLLLRKPKREGVGSGPVEGVPDEFTNFRTVEGNDGVLWFFQPGEDGVTTVFDPRTNRPAVSFVKRGGKRVFVDALGEPGIVQKAMVSLDIVTQ